MTNQEPEIVPGMHEAIETRRRQKGLTPGQFADAAGVTPQGLKRVRDGVKARYQDKVILGVALALDWPIDWYDRLLEGADGASLAEGAEPGSFATDFERVVAEDPALDEAGRDQILDLYRILRHAG